MFFFPYRADIKLDSWPVLTILLCVLCLVVFYFQTANERKVERATRRFCAEAQPRAFRLAVNTVYGDTSEQRCIQVMLGMHIAKDQQRFLRETAAGGRTLAGLSREQSDQFVTKAFADQYVDFANQVPKHLTRQLWYQPASWNVLHMITAAIAHGSWGHVLGNLVFFFAFEATLELLLGGLVYVAVLAALAMLSHSVYSLAMFATADALPTVGLSGVVYGVMALFVFFLPRTPIRCFAWIVIFFKRFSIPAWTLLVGFAGFDTYTLLSDGNTSNINLAAHVGGAGFGYLLGVALFRAKRDSVRKLASLGDGTPGDPAEQAAGNWWEERKRKW